MNGSKGFMAWAKEHRDNPINFKYYLKAKRDYSFAGDVKAFYKTVSGQDEGRGTVGQYLDKVVKPAQGKMTKTKSSKIVALISEIASDNPELATAMAQILAKAS